ncbi:hypothetical protein BN946_scf184921.g37 [Trametes cinnabarina]|uniref:Uncharacterized protein n=1 Tax=Pycnoporus cinnabarinus TaxID=5643 RepID=A0A060SNM4_PYCCI|nr:hypothetical protein BN946_scf184921.g37 [Trametes cinnabarina]
MVPRRTGPYYSDDVLQDIAVNIGNFYIFPNERHLPAGVVVCFILFLRTYALYGRAKRVLVLVVGVGAALLGISCWSIVGQHQGIELRGGCHLEADRMTAIRLAVSWEALFVFDLMIFTLTVCKTFRERYRHRVTLGHHDIISLILRDGALYFAVMASVNFANTLTFYPLLRGCLSTFASSVSVTMMSRLMLNLHGSALGRGPVDSSSGFPTASENITPMFFTSRISMPAAGLTTTFAAPDGELGYESVHSHLPGALGFREGVYVREAPIHGSAGGSGGYIDEVYELQDMQYPQDDDGRDAALRVRGRDGKVQV